MGRIIADKNFEYTLALIQGVSAKRPTPEEARSYMDRHRPVEEAPRALADWLEYDEVLASETIVAPKNIGGRPSANWAEVLAAFEQFVSIHGAGHGAIRGFCRFAGISERSFRNARRELKSADHGK